MLEATKGLTLTDEGVELTVARAKEAALESIRRMSVESTASKRPAKECAPKKAGKASLPIGSRTAGVRRTAHGTWVCLKFYLQCRIVSSRWILISSIFLFLASFIERSTQLPTQKTLHRDLCKTRPSHISKYGCKRNANANK